MKKVLALTVLMITTAAIGESQTTGRNTLSQRRVEQELIRLDEEWASAARSVNVQALNRIIADDFSMTTATGETRNKKEYIAELVSGVHKVNSLNPDNHQARIYGNVALLTHGGTTEGEYKGQDTSGSYRWTHIFVKRGKRWQCVANQMTRLAQR